MTYALVVTVSLPQAMGSPAVAEIYLGRYQSPDEALFDRGLFMKAQEGQYKFVDDIIATLEAEYLITLLCKVHVRAE